MKEKVIPFGEAHPVEVIQSSKVLVTVHASDNNEGYMLMGHGLNPLPNVGDSGKIVFEKGGPKGGYWQYYPNNNHK